ncbi:hypothetical protein HGK34_21855 [Myceligenerans sp. I2]|uniref:DNA/RNA non-specific endonuclease n=2 Tax=Myceligenerans indicum TaxID=2593663 RepID=A0ABS1LRM4_9MICO|nr:hypothetical protein [Myceligenerans indicum]
MDPDGNIVQVEFHTPESLRAKTELDGLIDELTDPAITSARWAQIEAEIAGLSGRVDQPAGAVGVDWPDMVRQAPDPDSPWHDGSWARELASQVPGGSRPAVHAGSMTPDQAHDFIDHEMPWMREVNAGRYAEGAAGFENNCTRAALAGDLTLGGKQVMAGPSAASRPITDIADTLGGQWHKADGPDAIIDRLDDLGDGSRGVVAIDRGDGKIGHVVNVINHERHGTVFLDPQTGDLARLRDGDRLYFLETSPGSSPHVDLGDASPGLERLSDTEIHGLREAAGQQGHADALGAQAPTLDGLQDLDLGDGGQRSRPEAPDTGSIAERFAAPEVAQQLSGEAPSPRKPFAALDNLEPNTAYEVPGRGTFYTDDTGKVVHVEAQYGRRGKLNWDLMNPQPDVTYVVNDHVFVTDHAGRAIEAYADDLQLGDADRSESIQSRIGNMGGDEYDGGHLLANMFAGGPEDINLVPMLSDLNQGNGSRDTFYAVEKDLRSHLERPPDAGPEWEPPRITFRVLPVYEGESRVPTMISVEYGIDGVSTSKDFPNE